jgi:hypothetical protein
MMFLHPAGYTTEHVRPFKNHATDVPQEIIIRAGAANGSAKSGVAAMMRSDWTSVFCVQFPCIKIHKRVLGTHPGDPSFTYRHEVPEVIGKLKAMNS